MRDTWKTAKVGIMVAVGLAATFLVYRYVDERAGGGDEYMVYALFPDAQGLIEKSRVVIAGIPVGYIEDIRLEGDKARVDMMIEPSVVIYEDATVAKETVSILGESILVINPGTVGQPVLEEGDRIQLSPQQGGLLGTVDQISQNIAAVTEQLQYAFGTDEAGLRMESALRNLSEALEGVNRTIQQNEEAITSTISTVERTTAAAEPRLIDILDNVEQTTADLRNIVRNNREGLNTAVGEVDDTVASIHRASEQLEEVLGDVGEVTERTARGEGTIGRLTSDDTLIDEVEGVVEGLGNLVGGLARLQTIVELRSEYNFLANTFKSYVSLRMQPREDYYYMIQLIDDPRGDISFSETTVHTSPPREGDPPFYQETRVTRTDSLRFSLMFAKRIGLATFRFGIIESTGGLGMDLHLFDDNLEINLDAFAVGEQTYPRFRARFAYQVVERLWVLGGIDDAVNDSRDFFLGAMLRFNDDDLKSILPFLGGSLSAGGGS